MTTTTQPLFVPCIENPRTGRLNKPVAGPMSYDEARSVLERLYPLAWRSCEACVQPAGLVALTGNARPKSVRP